MYQFSFEKLEVWRESRQLAKTIYLLTSKFPDTEKFSLTNQMRRAAISVSSNIAEGSSRTSKKDQAHFYQLAYSSLMELLNQCIISFDLEYINKDTLEEVRNKIGIISRMINAMRNKVLKD